MTEQMSNEIVDVLSKYDMTHVFTLDAFESVFQVTQYKNELLKRESFKSTITAIIKGTSMTRSWKNMFVKLRNIQTGFCCVIL
jgi:hypothetical protein